MASTSSTMPAFDTHKAVKALRQAGFDDVQAEAVVDQINGAVTENLVFKPDLAETERNLAARIDATKQDLAETERKLAARIDACASKEDLAETERKLAARIDATKQDLAETERKLAARIDACASKEDLRNYATKEELAQLELRMTVKMEALTGKMLRYMGGGLALVVALIKGLDLLVG
ncbi:MAG: hypothetical protein OXI79_05725 [Gammaproteobacteria bacterium]|nr:hypothetical protein [Gammaproteobacteria bacterium]